MIVFFLLGNVLGGALRKAFRPSTGPPCGELRGTWGAPDATPTVAEQTKKAWAGETFDMSETLTIFHQRSFEIVIFFNMFIQ